MTLYELGVKIALDEAKAPARLYRGGGSHSGRGERKLDGSGPRCSGDLVGAIRRSRGRGRRVGRGTGPRDGSGPGCNP
jgi:hypothetical protein